MFIWILLILFMQPFWVIYHWISHYFTCLFLVFALAISWVLKDLPSVEVLTRAKWDTLRTLYKQSILKLTYKMYHNDLPSCMTAHIVKLQPSYNLRNSLKLEIPPFKSNIKKYSISYRGPLLWNHLPIECRSANSVKSFSRMINKLTLIRDIDFSNLHCRR